jgi:ABC-type lipoprotein export system ATPase subunit
LSIAAGQWITLSGQSGSGKTTFLRLLGALDKPDRGSIHYFGENLASMSANALAKLRRQKIGFIFQSYHLLPDLTALENVMMPGRLAGMARSAMQARALQLLELTGMKARQHHLPAELSGGEQQRIAIARALMNAPPVILADEPTGNLDDQTSQEIMTLLKQLHQLERKTIIMVTHDRRLTEFADRSCHLENGRLMEHPK